MSILRSRTQYNSFIINYSKPPTYLFRVHTSKMYVVIKIFKKRLKLQKFWRQRWLSTFYSHKSLPCMQANTIFLFLSRCWNCISVELIFTFSILSQIRNSLSNGGLFAFFKCKLKHFLSNTNCLSFKWWEPFVAFELPSSIVKGAEKASVTWYSHFTQFCRDI